MVSGIPITEGPYLRDILDEPRALLDTLAGLGESPALEKLAAELERGAYQRIVLTGMGGSFYVLHPLNLQLVSQGFTSFMVETSELIHSMPRLLDSRTLLIALSQSGRTAEILRMLDWGQDHPRTIGITNTPDSPLALRSDVAVLMHAGEEFSVSCKTSVASLGALQWVGDSLSRQDLRQTRGDLEQAALAAEHYLASWRDHVQSLCAEFAGVRHLFFVGRGGSLAAVCLSGTIVKEAAHFHSEGLSGPAFRHGPFEMLSQEVFVVVFDGDPSTAPFNRGLVRDIRNAGGRAALVGPETDLVAFHLPPAPPAARAILEILPAQMLSVALAALAGREAGKFKLITKITTVE